jgi:hypothetical protein
MPAITSVSNSRLSIGSQLAECEDANERALSIHRRTECDGYLTTQTGNLRSIAAQASTLLNTSIFRGIPDADDFTHFLLFALSEARTTHRKKSAILTLFLGEVEAPDLEGVDVFGLGIPATRLLASTVNSLLSPLYWAEVGIRHPVPVLNHSR